MVDGCFYTLPFLSFLQKVTFKCTKNKSKYVFHEGKGTGRWNGIADEWRKVNLCYMTTLYLQLCLYAFSALQVYLVYSLLFLTTDLNCSSTITCFI